LLSHQPKDEGVAAVASVHLWAGSAVPVDFLTLESIPCIKPPLLERLLVVSMFSLDLKNPDSFPQLRCGLWGMVWRFTSVISALRRLRLEDCLSLGVGTSLDNIARPWLLLKMFS
jgi:hypothetical protein